MITWVFLAKCSTFLWIRLLMLLSCYYIVQLRKWLYSSAWQYVCVKKYLFFAYVFSFYWWNVITFSTNFIVFFFNNNTVNLVPEHTTFIIQQLRHYFFYLGNDSKKKHLKQAKGIVIIHSCNTWASFTKGKYLFKGSFLGVNTHPVKSPISFLYSGTQI